MKVYTLILLCFSSYEIYHSQQTNTFCSTLIPSLQYNQQITSIHCDSTSLFMLSIFKIIYLITVYILYIIILSSIKKNTNQTWTNQGCSKSSWQLPGKRQELSLGKIGNDCSKNKASRCTRNILEYSILFFLREESSKNKKNRLFVFLISRDPTQTC